MNGVKSPSKFTSLSSLKQAKEDHGQTAGGSEYSPEELETLIQAKETAIAERVTIDWIHAPQGLQTREQWLQAATDIFRESLFKRLEFKVPHVHVSVGLPGGRNAKKTIGQHWSPEASDDKKSQIFISPTIDDGIQVLGVLVHELVHSVIGNKAGHGPKFRKCAVAVGLEGKMTETHAGPTLAKVCEAIIEKLGPYPHAKLNLGLSPIKKQTTRMIKMACPMCEYICRASRKVIETHGPAICPGCELPMNIGG